MGSGLKGGGASRWYGFCKRGDTLEAERGRDPYIVVSSCPCMAPGRPLNESTWHHGWSGD
jgi:hypothetical protein